MAHVRTDSILQLEAAECGAASLSMILSHFGRRLPLDELRAACGVSRDGSRASSLLKAARSYGLIAKGLRAEPVHLRGMAPPMIAFVNFNHFLVVEGFKSDRVFLNDPAVGHRVVSQAEFDAMFTGVVLTFKPGECFERGDTRPSLWRSLYQRASMVRLGIAYVFLASLALVVPGILVPVFSRVFVDQILVQQLDDWLLPLLLGMLVTAVARYVLILLQTHHLTRAEIQLAIQGSRELFAHILHLPVAFFGARYAGEIAERLGLNDRLAALLAGDISRSVLSLITAGFFLSVMVVFSWQVAAVVALLNVFNLGVLIGVSGHIAESYQREAIDRGKLTGLGVSGIQDIESFKAAGYEDSFFGRWAGLHANVVNSSQRIGSLTLYATSFPSLTAALTSSAVLTLGGLEVIQGGLTIGSLVALQSLAISFTRPVTALTNLGMGLQDVRSHTERIDDVMNQRIDDEHAGLGRIDTQGRLPGGSIQLLNVSFGYLPLEPPLIQGFDLDIKSGSRVALVGASGSGKSTLGRIIAGLNRPSIGELLFDNIDVRQWPASVLSATRAYVDQEIVLFEGTVRDNLTLWDVSIPDAAIVRAARDAAIHDVIASRPGGYDARVEEDGRNYSGGQRQRLEIARALANDPRILVLDEATSALDPVTEAEVMKNLRRRGCTLVIIAHRLSTVRDCDEIIVLERGEPVERGTHDQLVAQDGAYRRLIEE
ncbi:NHLP family bacteriocin export ABC transporter peptidase/permease/ATPase subunit [Lamprobacter modestohalophilus]|uniref:NHLP family bacteriocin export ABC transporter peptidase/permease/ATPase subunit n=1 Tax=Lamprobacter modestohalophilus TaxID=1064514 RepID=UPI002ADEE93B|nr:NHLP family bacteriocin export ABC transporter peptidase/permease/ATPase subunit [Lamprobacter modestohalophilus]MEA1051737.1 NHLP family bacteriocin export ABC transporter peptidase/permease/ATPase subunit [Lamprobacter modestohalophilus]